MGITSNLSSNVLPAGADWCDAFSSKPIWRSDLQIESYAEMLRAEGPQPEGLHSKPPPQTSHAKPQA